MKTDPRVAICLVAFRNRSDVLQCLSALSQQSFAAFEVIICENGGPAAFAELAAAIPQRLAGGQPVAVIADHANPGYAGGINRCIAARPGQDYYWVLNSDTVPQPDALAAMIADLERRGLDAIGGPVVAPDGTIGTCGGGWLRWVAGPTAIGKGQPADPAPDTATVELRLAFISGASLLVTRHFIAAAGLMREDYFLYGEEVEWCLRARRRGLALGFSPGGAVLHFQGSTTGSGYGLAVQGRMPIYLNERNRVLILYDTEPEPIVAIAAFGALLLIGWRYGRRGAWRAMKIALTGWWDGLRNRRGKPGWLTS